MVIIQSHKILIFKIFSQYVLNRGMLFQLLQIINLRGAEIILYSTDRNSSVNFGM